MKLFKRPTYSPIGIDIGTCAIKAAQMRLDDAGPVLVRAASIPRAASDATISPGEAARLLNVLWRMDFRGKAVVAAVPPAALLSSVMELPPRSSGAPLNDIARQELARSHKADAAGVELTWWELPGGARANEGTHVMAVGCKHADAEALMDAFETAGGDVIAIDAPTLALVRAAGKRLAPAPSLTALVDLSWSGADLIIVQGHTIVYERCMHELGLAALVAQIKTKLGVDDESARYLVRHTGCTAGREGEGAYSADAQAMISAHIDTLASELRVSISYAARRFASPAQVALISGGAAMLPGLISRLGDQTEVPVQLLALAGTHEADLAALGACEPTTLMTAIGLALHSTSKAVAA